jgi:hypothetical protein
MTTRSWLALVLLTAALLINIGILIAGELEGWALATIVLLGAAGASLLAERRPWQ